MFTLLKVWLKWCYKFKCIVPWSCRLVQHTEDLSFEQLETIKHQAGILTRWFDAPLEGARKNADKMWRAQGSPMVWGVWEKEQGDTIYKQGKVIGPFSNPVPDTAIVYSIYSEGARGQSFYTGERARVEPTRSVGTVPDRTKQIVHALKKSIIVRTRRIRTKRSNRRRIAKQSTRRTWTPRVHKTQK